MFLGLIPMLRTKQLQETIDFYTQTLGFTCEAKNDSRDWASLKKDAVRIMIVVPNEHGPFKKPRFTGSLYMRVDNIDELWNTLKDTARIRYEIKNFEWGMREFGIYDNNGYLLQFGQSIEESV